MSSPTSGPRALAAAVTVAATAALLPAPAQAAAPTLTLVVSDIQARPAGPLAPMIAVAIGSIAGMSVNFISSKLFVFR